MLTECFIKTKYMVPEEHGTFADIMRQTDTTFNAKVFLSGYSEFIA